MTATTITAQPDPFVVLLDSLNNAAKTVGDLDTPITDAQGIVSVVANVLADLDELPILLTGIDDLMVGLEGVLAVLDAVPIVGAAVGICTDVATTAQDLVKGANKAITDLDASVIKPCRTAFDDLKTGLTAAHEVVHAISNTVPDYINTVEILHFMAEIAEPLTRVLEGSESAADLSALVKTLNEVEKEVDLALTPVSQFLAGLGELVQAIGRNLGPVFNNMKDAMATVETNLRGIEGIFDPIVNAFNNVADFIKPIRWALDAISWIFNSVCKPVLDSILESTGLNKLLDGLESEVEEKLGIKSIIDLVKSGMDGRTATEWQNQGGVQAVDAGQSDWDNVSGVLKRFNTRDNGNLKNDINMLISAVAGTSIDPHKPGIISDWPERPGINVPQGDVSPPTLGRVVHASSLAIPLVQSLRGNRLVRGFHAMLAIPNKAPAAPSLDVSGLLPENTPAGAGSSLDQLKKLAMEARGRIADIAQLGPNLVADLKSYDSARTLPGDFRESLEDLIEIFNDSIQILDFLEPFGFLTLLIEDLKASLAIEVTSVGSIIASCDGFIQSGKIMDGVVDQIIAAVPTAGVFTGALEYLEEISRGADSLSSVMTKARELDAKLNNAHLAELNDLQNQLDASASAVADQIDQVEKRVEECLAAGITVRATLEAYAAALGKLSGDAAVISSRALPDLTKGVHLLNTLTSILDPLSGLLRKLDCVDGNKPEKVEAAAAINIFKTDAVATINGQDKALRNLFDVVLSKVIRTDNVNADIEAINALVKKDQPVFDQAGKTLTAALTALPDVLKPNRYFTFKNKDGKTIIVANLFIDQKFVANAQPVLEAIQPSAN